MSAVRGSSSALGAMVVGERPVSLAEKVGRTEWERRIGSFPPELQSESTRKDPLSQSSLRNQCTFLSSLSQSTHTLCSAQDLRYAASIC